jgi:Na+-driven multidrug efflux pump
MAKNEDQVAEVNYARRGWLTLLWIPAWTVITIFTGPLVKSIEDYNVKRYVEIILSFGVFALFLTFSTYCFFISAKKHKISLLFAIIGTILSIFLYFSVYYLIVAYD